MTRKGWHREPARHSLSARGVKTNLKKQLHTIPFKFAKESETAVWKSKDFGARFIIRSKLVEEGVEAPWDDGRYPNHNKFRVTVMNWDNKKKTSFYWYGSQNDYTNGVTKMSEHDILYAVASWLGDASSACTQDLEGWAGDFGYDDDSMKAIRVYRELEKSGKKVDELLGPEYGADVWGMMAQEIMKSIGEM